VVDGSLGVVDGSLGVVDGMVLVTEELDISKELEEESMFM
jgi:hypothetical protein